MPPSQPNRPGLSVTYHSGSYRELPRRQTCPLASALASADPGLAHRRLPQCAVIGQVAPPGAADRGWAGCFRIGPAPRLDPQRVSVSDRPHQPTFPACAPPLTSAHLNDPLGNTPVKHDPFGWPYDPAGPLGSAHLFFDIERLPPTAAQLIPARPKPTTNAANFPDESVEKCPKNLQRQSRRVLRHQLGPAQNSHACPRPG